MDSSKSFTTILSPVLPTNLSDISVPVSSSSRLSHPNPTAHTCNHCQKILVKPPLNQSQHGFRYRLPQTKSDVRRAARDGCPVFKLLLHGYLSGTSTQGAREFARGLHQQRNWKYARAGAVSHADRIIYFAESLSKRPFQVRFDKEGNLLFTCMGWSSGWFNVTASPGMYHAIFLILSLATCCV